MSFYGSVYYQLVDTFYKVVIQNKGDKTFTFNKNLINPSGTASDKIEESQAIGRKGVISLDSGNYWISFSKPSDAEGMAPYAIWHSPANPNGKNALNGMLQKTVSVDDKGNPTDKNLKYIQLSDHDFIETHQAVYDEAGHVVQGKTKTQLYRLPKAEVNEKVDKLIEAVGESTNKTLPDITDKTLFGYVEENTKDIAALESSVGDWFENYSGSISEKPTISEFIGDFNTFTGDSYFGYGDKFVSLTEFIGSMPDLNGLQIKEQVPQTVIGAIKMLRDANADLSTTVQTNNNGIYASIGNPIDNKIDIYEHLRTIYGVNDGKVSDSLTTLANRAKALEDKDDSLDADIKTINDKLGSNWSATNTVRKAVTDITNNLGADWSSTNTVRKAVTDINNNLGAGWTSTNTVTKAVNDINTNLGTGWSSTNTVSKAISDVNTNLGTGWSSTNTVSKAISDINSKMGWERATSILSDIVSLENRAKDLETHKDNSEKDIQDLKDDVSKHYENAEDSKSNSELSKRIDAAVAAIGDLPENTSAAQRITDVENNFNTAIGIVPENSNVMAELNTAFENIENLIGEVPTDSTVMQELQTTTKTLQDNIDALSASLGNVEEGQNVYELIGQNEEEIEKINITIGSIPEGKTVAGLILENSTAINKCATTETVEALFLKKADAENAYVSVNTLGDISSWGNSDNTIASKINSLEGIVEGITDVIGDSTQLEEGKTIIALLLEIKQEIAAVNARIDELHSTGPLTPEEDDGSETNPDDETLPDDGEAIE